MIGRTDRYGLHIVKVTAQVISENGNKCKGATLDCEPYFALAANTNGIYQEEGFGYKVKSVSYESNSKLHKKEGVTLSFKEFNREGRPSRLHVIVNSHFKPSN